MASHCEKLETLKIEFYVKNDVLVKFWRFSECGAIGAGGSKCGVTSFNSFFVRKFGLRFFLRRFEHFLLMNVCMYHERLLFGGLRRIDAVEREEDGS